VLKHAGIAVLLFVMGASARADNAVYPLDDATDRGTIVTGPQLYAVHAKGGLIGYADAHGTIVVKPQFFSGDVFSDGIAVSYSNRDAPQAVLVDTTGKLTPLEGIEVTGWFSDGVAPARRGKRSGFIDATGKFVIQPTYADARVMSSGLAPVNIGGKWGYIKRSGKIAFRPTWLDAREFRDGRAAVKTKSGWGFIDTTGAVVVAAEFSRVHDFRDGLALVTRRDGTRGYIDPTGAFVIAQLPGNQDPSKGSLATYHDFFEGTAFVLEDGGAYHIDKQGKPLYRARFGSVNTFSGGLAPARPPGQQTKWGYIDRTGAWVIKPAYDFAHVKVGELILVANDDNKTNVGGALIRRGFIDIKGNVIIPLNR
jgi:hypothetical protein